MGILREPGLDKMWEEYRNSDLYIQDLKAALEYYSRTDDKDSKRAVRLIKQILKSEAKRRSCKSTPRKSKRS